jgi:hypothetical protein
MCEREIGVEKQYFDFEHRSQNNFLKIPLILKNRCSSACHHTLF